MSKLASLSMRDVATQAVLVFALALLMMQSAHAQSRPWPIRHFQVVEMTDDEIANDTGGVFNDTIDAVVGAYSGDVAGDPARAGQRAEIERYLGKVAGQLQAWGFPPPALGRVVKLENGERAYRVYVLATVGASKYFPSNGGDGANGGSLRLHLTDIHLSRNLDFQDYATIAHELFHAVQFNTRFYSVNPRPPPVGIGHWITEGQAEAVGEDLAWAYAPADASRDAMRWGRRDYTRPLAIARRDPGPKGDAYYTASFWRYLAERDYLNLTSGPTVRPGIAAPVGAVHYSYLASLLSNPPQPRDCRTNDDRCPLEIQWLNAGLRGYDNFQQPLRKIFPEFAVTMAAYGDPGGRVPADNSSGLGADYWRSGVLADCGNGNEIVNGPIREYVNTLRLKGVSARCVVVPDLFNDQAEVLVEARASSSKLLDQIVFGLAGDPKHAKPMLTDGARTRGEKSAMWPVRLAPGRDNVLVFANVARDAPETQDQTLEIVFRLEYARVKPGGNARRRSDFDIGPAPGLNLDRIGLKEVITYPVEINRARGWQTMCGLRISAYNSENGDTIDVAIDSKQPISAGDTFSVLDLGKNRYAPEEHPSMALVSYQTDVKMTTGKFGPTKGKPIRYTADARGYLGQSGVLEITAFSPSFVSGILNFFGKQRPPQGYKAPPMVGPESMNVGFEFGFTPRINAGMKSVSLEGCFPE